MFEATSRDGVLQIAHAGTRWLSTGIDGGVRRADAAYNVSVPEGWHDTDPGGYVADRRADAGFDPDGPTLITGVDLDHARGARLDPVEVYATAGVSNPAALPMDHGGSDGDTASPHAGTVNLLVGTTRALEEGGLAELLGTVVEAKAATLLSETGFPGTTTDAVVVGCDPDGESADFAGSATPVGAAARACVREAIRASLRSRYPDREYPENVADAEHGVETTRRARVFEP